jgi:hypothetical protein
MPAGFRELPRRLLLVRWGRTNKVRTLAILV